MLEKKGNLKKPIKMFNILKRKSLEIYWWTKVDGLEKSSPILKSQDLDLPDYWKSMPSWIEPDNILRKGTVKTCPAITDFFDTGYIVPLWCDVKFIFKESGNHEIYCSDKRFHFDAHSNEQYINHLPQRVKDEIKIILKADCPWRVKTPDGYSMLQLPLYYHFDNLFEVLPGTIWTDIHHHINQQVAIKKYGEFILKKGHPIAMYIPYRRDNFSTLIEGPNERNEKWDKITITNFLSKFRNAYRSSQKKQKEQCPFHSIFK